MSVNIENRYVSGFQTASKVAAGITMLVGVLVLVGWLLGIALLKSIVPGLANMKANTALAFFAAGWAIWLVQSESTNQRRLFLRRACIILVTGLSLLTLSEYVFGWDLRIDQFLFQDVATPSNPFPGRMAEVTAFSFILLGIAFFLLDVLRRFRAAQFLALIAGMFALLSFIGYLYGVESFYRIAAFSSIALPTSITLLVLSLGFLFVLPKQGWIALLASDTVAGVVARRLLPAAIFVPIVVGWLRLQGERLGLFDIVFGQALFAISNIVVFGLLVIWSAALLYRSDSARQKAEDTLRHSNVDLDRRVIERTEELTRVNERLASQVTERERAESKFRALLEAAPDAIVIINQQGQIELVNSQVENLFGYPRGELVGQSVDLLVSEPFRGIHSTHRTNYFKVPRVREMGAGLELYGRRKDGTQLQVEISLSPVDAADGLLVAAAIRDITVRKHAEAALRESEERFSKAFRFNPAALTITRLSDSRFIDVNENFQILFGYRREELIGQPSTKFPINLNPGKREELMRRLREGGAIRNFEMELFTREGEPRLMLMSVDPFELEGEPHVLTTMLDVTAQKKAEAALRESEAKLRALFEVLPVGVSILNQKREVLESNPALERILRMSKEDLARGVFSGRRFIHTDGIPVQRQELPSVRASEEQKPILDVEMGMMMEAGEIVWTSVSAAPVSVADLGVVVVTTDITQRKKIEEELKQERDLLKALMDNIPDTIYFKDTESRFVRINRAQARFLGVSDAREVIGKTDADFQAPQLAAEFYEEEQKLLKTGVPIIDRQEFNPTADGQARWLASTKVPMPDRDGHIIGLLGISHDITERIKSAEAVIRVNEQLTQQVREISLLNEFQEQLQTCVATEEVYQVTAQWGSRLFPNESGALFVINHSRNWVDTGAVWGEAAPNSQVFGLQDCWALRRGRLHVSGVDYTNIPCRHSKGAAILFSICMPLIAQGETLGVFHLRTPSDSKVHQWNEAQQQLARAVSDSVGLAIANLNLRAKLREQSIRDPLTDLFNRRYMEESLTRELLRAKRTEKCVGIIMLDVDHFKRINDTQGHHVGDAVLRQLGHFLEERMRGGDIACRYGGEEFTLILPEATLEQTYGRAEQLRQELKALELEYAGKPIGTITISFGVAAYPAHGKVAEEVLRAADMALYRAKHEGRDRVVVAG